MDEVTVRFVYLPSTEGKTDNNNTAIDQGRTVTVDLGHGKAGDSSGNAL